MNNSFKDQEFNFPPEVQQRVDEFSKVNPQAKATRLKLVQEDTSLTSDLRFVLENMFSHTGGQHERASLDKVLIANALRTNVLDFPDDAQIVYFASGVDVYFPLALGGRKIILVDGDLDKTQEEIEKLLENFKPERKDGSIRINFDFGKGKEEVDMTLASINAQDFKPSGKIGLVFSFLGTDRSSPFFNPELLDSLVVGGFIFDDRYLLPPEIIEDLESYGLREIKVEGFSDRYQGQKIYQKISPDMGKLKEVLRKLKEKTLKEMAELAAKIPPSNLTSEDIERLGYGRQIKPGEFWDPEEK